MRKILTTEQLADYLSQPVATITAWRDSNAGPRYLEPMPGIIYYSEADVTAWLKSSTVDTTRLTQLRACFADSPFTTRQAARVLGVSIATAKRTIALLILSSHIEKTPAPGRAPQYRLK